jgi:hypothetical protein
MVMILMCDDRTILAILGILTDYVSICKCLAATCFFGGFTENRCGRILASLLGAYSR